MGGVSLVLFIFAEPILRLFTPDDQIVEVRFKAVDHKGAEVVGSWSDVREHQWGFANYRLQLQAPHVIDARVKRGDETFEVTLAATEDPSWAVADRGLELSPERRLQKAEGLLEALRMGADRTVRSVKMIYLGLYSMVFGQISYKMMSGPISLAGDRSLVWTLGAVEPDMLEDIRVTGATVIAGNLDPMAELVRIQRLSVDVAEAKGLDPDQPRHLTRSVVLR